MNIVEKAVAGSLVLIGVFLIVRNPQGTSAATNSLTRGIVSIDKALQGR